MTQVVPPTVFDAAAEIAGMRSQQRALAAEVELLADRYLETLRAMKTEGHLGDLVAAIEGFKITYGAGWERRLKAASLPTLRTATAMLLGQCNDGEGRWLGSFPLATDAYRPARGTWVVYQLLQGDELLYIGSTGAFAERIRTHAYTKGFDSWRAARCANEGECRDLEGALIDRYRPPLNRMIATPKLALR